MHLKGKSCINKNFIQIKLFLIVFLSNINI